MFFFGKSLSAGLIGSPSSNNPRPAEEKTAEEQRLQGTKLKEGGDGPQLVSTHFDDWAVFGVRLRFLSNFWSYFMAIFVFFWMFVIFMAIFDVWSYFYACHAQPILLSTPL